MNAWEMRALMRKEPFEPFRIHLVDGRTIDITYPFIHLVTQLRMVVGIPNPNDPTVADRSIWVEWSEIKRVEPLTPTPA